MNRMKFFSMLLMFLMLAPNISDAQDEVKFSISEGIDDVSLKTTIETNVTALLNKLNDNSKSGKKFKLSQDIILKEATEQLNQMLENSRIECRSKMILGRIINIGNGNYQVRGIPVTMLAADNDEQKQEIVIDLNSEGKISGVSIAIGMEKYKTLMSESEGVTDMARRQIIIDFIENFRTAYNRKDMEYLQKVYSDEALIITGRVVRNTPSKDMAMKSLSAIKIEYVKQKKKEYLEKLDYVFKKAKFLNVKFSDIEIMQHPKYPDIYGVTLLQNWHSRITRDYQDEGYLFLMIDFKDENNPLIQVRTWQPTKDDQGNSLGMKRDDVFHLGSFRIVR
jgi:hypothetical protein